MKQTRLVTLLCLGLLACSGTATSLDDGDAGSSSTVDAGTKPLPPAGFTARADGWPAGERVLGMGALDGKVFAATAAGVYALAFLSGETIWVAQDVPLTGAEKPTSLARVDDVLVLTVAGGGAGGVLTRATGADWRRLDAAPARPSWFLVRKGSALLLLNAEGLSTAATLAGPWTKKTTGSGSLFARPVSHFAAASSQQRLFLSGDPTNGFGGLYVSDDDGATWRTGFLSGDVLSLAAGASAVLTETSVDGQQRSDNYGGTFHKMAVGAPTGSLAFIQDKAWAGTSSGLRVSADLGLTWADDAHGLPAGTAVRGLYSSGGLVLADSFSGPFLLSLD